MNREFYQSLNEAYQAINEKEQEKGQVGAGAASVVKPTVDALSKAASETGYAAKAYGKGLMQGKKVGKDDPMTDRVANAAGRTAHTLGGKYYAKAVDAVNNAAKWGYEQMKGANRQLRKDFKKEDVQFMVGAYLLDSGLAVTPQDASAIVEHMTDEYLEHMLNQVPEETVLELMEGGSFAGISDEALEKAAAASLKKHKEQGYKVPGLDAMDDVVKRITARKKGQV